MATMNKPGRGDANWYQSVTDNWTSIEDNLIDKSLVTTKGDLVTASAASTPARQAVGTNGQILNADSTQTTGLGWITPASDYTNAVYMDKLVLDKRFFSAASLLPGTQHYESAADAAPTPDWDNTGVSPTAVGSTKRWTSVAATQLLGWDLGAARQRILFIISGFLSSGGNRLLFASDSKPGSGDLTGNGYAGGLNSAIGSGVIYKVAAGVYTNLSATNYVAYRNHPYGAAMLFDNGNVRYFYRMGNFNWIEGTYKNDGTYTTLRYCGVRLLSGGALSLGAVSIYYDT
jgi:hypothetical protein